MRKRYTILLLIIVVIFISCNKKIDEIKKDNIDENNIISNNDSNSHVYDIIYNEIIYIDNSIFSNIDSAIFYINNDMNLYENPEFSNKIITVLPKYSAVNILELGESVLLNNINAPWANVSTQTGYTGWCFSGYLREVEDNVAEEYAIRHPGNSHGPGMSYFKDNKMNNVTSINTIIKSQGYYIQNEYYWYNSPEILLLIVDNGNVFIREIDIIDKELITRNEILLEYNGSNYVYNDTKLGIIDDKLHINYNVNKSAISNKERWKYEIPYKYAGDIDSPIPYIVQKLTTDYLLSFTGEYTINSYMVISQENKYFHENRVKNASIQVSYEKEKKCLNLKSDFLNNEINLNDIKTVDITADTPFHWMFGEFSGYISKKCFFYKGGILVHLDEASGYYDEKIDDYVTNVLNYVVFFTK